MYVYTYIYIWGGEGMTVLGMCVKVRKQLVESSFYHVDPRV